MNFKDFGGFFILEPFGLLNFLKTLLPTTQEEGQPVPEKEEEKLPSPPPEKEEKENAYLHFLEEHERRARRK